MARSPDKLGQTMFKLKTYQTTELKEETLSEKGFQKSINMNTDISGGQRNILTKFPGGGLNHIIN